MNHLITTQYWLFFQGVTKVVSCYRRYLTWYRMCPLWHHREICSRKKKQFTHDQKLSNLKSKLPFLFLFLIAGSWWQARDTLSLGNTASGTLELLEYLFNETLLCGTDFITANRCSTFCVPELFFYPWLLFFFFFLKLTLIKLYGGRTSTSTFRRSNVKCEGSVRDQRLT